MEGTRLQSSVWLQCWWWWFGLDNFSQNYSKHSYENEKWIWSCPLAQNMRTCQILWRACHIAAVKGRTKTEKNAIKLVFMGLYQVWTCHNILRPFNTVQVMGHYTELNAYKVTSDSWGRIDGSYWGASLNLCQDKEENWLLDIGLCKCVLFTVKLSKLIQLRGIALPTGRQCKKGLGIKSWGL